MSQGRAKIADLLRRNEQAIKASREAHDRVHEATDDLERTLRALHARMRRRYEDG